MYRILKKSCNKPKDALFSQKWKWRLITHLCVQSRNYFKISRSNPRPRLNFFWICIYLISYWQCLCRLRVILLLEDCSFFSKKKNLNLFYKLLWIVSINFFGLLSRPSAYLWFRPILETPSIASRYLLKILLRRSDVYGLKFVKKN